MSEQTKQKKLFKSNFLDKFSFITFILLLISGICLTVAIYFQKKYFNYFFVNGQSMYPTLNLHATDANGIEYGDSRGATVQNGSKHVDYGFYDTHEEIINNISRFDIIICKYSETDNSDKIKRVIVMPGETFYIDISSTNYGKLYIKNSSGEFDYVEQPIDVSKISSSYNSWSTPHTLELNEYFVMGDNRNHSADSRQNGPIKKSYIQGKVVGLVGECTIGIKDYSFYPSKISYYSPRYF